MSVRAKFRVEEITEHAWAKGAKTIKLQPVVGNADPKSENSKFFASTPSGSIQLGTVNMEAAVQFEVGAEFYVTFDRADGPR